MYSKKKCFEEAVIVTNQAIPLLRIGEKMIVWSHVTPSLQEILDNVSLYWFTGCYPTSIWIYRTVRSTNYITRAPCSPNVYGGYIAADGSWGWHV